MVIATYVALVMAAIAISLFALVPAIILGAFAAGLALRYELRWAARRAKPPRVMLTPVLQAIPEHEGQ